MKILDLINIMILNEFNQFKTLVKNKYSSYIKNDCICLNVYDIYNIYYYEQIKKSENECNSLMNKWIYYGLVEEYLDKYDYYEELTIKIDF
jgi:hypothetical protein